MNTLRRAACAASLCLLTPLAVQAGGLSLSTGGACPGQVTVSVTGASPSTSVLLVRGSGPGSLILPGGPCAGTEIGLSNPGILTPMQTDASGNATAGGNAPAGLCGLSLQVFDRTACAVSNVATLPAAPPGPPAIALETVATGINDPVVIRHAGDGSGRLFAVEQQGVIRIISGGAVLPTPFLDIQARVACCGERGLLGLDFHPDYASNGFFYVNYTDNSGDTVVSRFSVTANANVADPASEFELLNIGQPFSNHNGGDVHFGPDGYLYISTGDGGSGGDPQDNGQTLSTMLGKLLRIDVDGTPPYAIPADNPFVGNPLVAQEIWAYGLRNPWRFSFDRDTGDLFIGDVGQSEIEEIDFQPAASAGGENYGWNRMEGSECFNPSTNCNDGSLVLPILEYPHFGGGTFNCAVTGGYRYRGSEFPEMAGFYFYADNCSGIIWAAQENAGQWTTFEVLDTNNSISTFGEDENGELYIGDLSGSGSVRKIIVP